MEADREVVEWATKDSALELYVPAGTWVEYRVLRKRWWTVFWVGLLTFFVGGALLEFIVPSGYPVLAIAVIWFGMLGIERLKIIDFRCPRCGKCYFGTSWYRNTFARHCFHCGLPKWDAPSGEDT